MDVGVDESRQQHHLVGQPDILRRRAIGVRLAEVGHQSPADADRRRDQVPVDEHPVPAQDAVRHDGTGPNLSWKCWVNSGHTCGSWPGINW